MKYILLLLAVFIFTASYSQRYDSTNFVRCQIIKIQPDMRVGFWLTVERDNGEVRYAVRNRLDKKTKELFGECILLGKDQWNDLYKTKR